MNQTAESETKLSSCRSPTVEFTIRSPESTLFILRSKCRPQLFKRAFLRLTNRRAKRVKHIL